MNKIYYNMLFKRKSFHMFKEVIPLTDFELNEISTQLTKLHPLISDINVKFKIVKKEETNCKRGEYCILIYSEIKESYLQNVGYLVEQLDLWLAYKDIGVCWYGLGKVKDQKCDGLDYVIMLAIGKTLPKYFRKDYTKARRKHAIDIYVGESINNIENIVRYAPSACNSQPWFIEYENDTITLYRIVGKKSIMPQNKMCYINRIDIGIMQCFIEVFLNYHNINFDRKLYYDTIKTHEQALDIEDKIMNAKYNIKKD